MQNTSRKAPNPITVRGNKKHIFILPNKQDTMDIAYLNKQMHQEIPITIHTQEIINEGAEKSKKWVNSKNTVVFTK